jgi:hypothetical protein
LPSAPALPPRDIFHDIQNGANSILTVAATRVSDAAGHVQSAVSSATASLPRIEDYIPQNCSIGTEQFCVGYRHSQNLSCNHLPFDLSVLLPDAAQSLPGPVRDAFREQMGRLSPLADHLDRLPSSIDICLFTGLISVLLVVVPFAWLGYSRWTSRKVATMPKQLVYLATPVVGCTPYSALVVLQSRPMKEAKTLPAWVDVQQGVVLGLGVGLLVCAMAFVTLLAFASSRRGIAWVKDRLRVRGNVRGAAVRAGHQKPSGR